MKGRMGYPRGGSRRSKGRRVDGERARVDFGGEGVSGLFAWSGVEECVVGGGDRLGAD